MCDYSICFTKEEIEAHPVIKGYQSKVNYEHNQKYSSPEYFAKQAKTQYIWQIPYVHDTYDEDNDTAEDSSSEEDDSDEDTVEKMAE